MKICVVTLVGLFNYGNRLQNYAVTRALEARGHEVATVGSSWRPPVEAAKRFLRGVIGRSVDPAASMSEARLDRFREFNSLIDVERLPRLGCELDERFDKFVVGSDQVWNPNYLYDERGYFLSFASPEKRVALSASFGVDRIPEDRARGFREGLRGIPSISVREEEGAVIVRELAGRVAPVLIDPTMAVDASEWRPLERADCTPGGEYVFSYVLGKSEEAERVLSDLGSRGVAIVKMTDRGVAGEPNAGPREFLSLIDNASLVVTNSFHGSVFSTLFGKPLCIVRRDGANDMSSRLATLAGKFGLSEEARRSEVLGVPCVADYSGVDEALARERAAFDAFLDGAL